MTVSVSYKINGSPLVTKAQWSRKEDRVQVGTWSNGKFSLILLGKRMWELSLQAKVCFVSLVLLFAEVISHCIFTQAR